MTRMPAVRLVAVVLVLMLGLLASGCSGEKKVSDGKSPTEVMELAKKTLDETSGVHLMLSTKDLPSEVNGILSAEGDATHAPAFDGTLKASVKGSQVDVPVISVDGKVYAQLPFTPDFQEINPEDFNAPDPAQLLSADTGFSSLLPITKGLTEGATERGGDNNDEVLTTFTGTVAGDAMKQVIPSAAGDSFKAKYLITSEGELRSADFTGVFYPDSAEMTYTVAFTNYDSEPEITAP